MNTQDTLLKLINFILKVFISAHYFVCLWVYLGDKELWQAENLPWLLKNSSMFSVEETKKNMIFSYYWVFQVFSTVGYGDFTGGTKYEYLITLFLEFLGLLVFSWISYLLEILLNKNFNYE